MILKMLLLCDYVQCMCERERMRVFSVMCRIDCFKKNNKLVTELSGFFFSKEESHKLVNKTNPPLELRS